MNEKEYYKLIDVYKRQTCCCGKISLPFGAAESIGITSICLLYTSGTSSFGDWVIQKDLEEGALTTQMFFYYKAD